MKILLLIDTLANEKDFPIGLLKVLKEKRYKVICISPYDSYSKELENLGFEYRNIHINNKGTTPFEIIKLIREYYNLFKKLDLDIILQYTTKPNIYSSIAARLLEKNVLSNISGLGSKFENDDLSSKIAKWLYKVSFAKDIIFFQNSHDRDLFLNNKLIKEKQTHLIPSSYIKTNIYKPLEKNIQSNNLTFIIVERLDLHEEIVEYIEAIKVIKKKYPNIVFKLLGSLYYDNPTGIKEELTSWIKDGLIYYLGHSDDVKSEILKADCIVLPSYREGLARVLLETGSLAKPIITANAPGCRDVVDHEINGFLYKMNSSKELALQIDRMINLNQEQRVKMGIKSRKKIIDHLDEQFLVEKYLSIIKKIDKEIFDRIPKRWNQAITLR